ncbi:TspO/MBR-related protein [Rhodocollybia butyracea]|uniref:TspO/MBR-related protein n=1 Tax=Rhodocollybia butyracea TaxID=206335 RepID=A0A9P5UEZ0_9AGAR|nr:TspO/MBR-related protein [Rhodocollybia butyracea]
MSSFHISSVFLSVLRNPVTALGLPLVLGMISGPPTAKVNLRFPPGRPPRQVFPIVWPLLYLSMGYASHLAVKSLDVFVSSSSRSALTLGITLYYAQLGMNLAWSSLFLIQDGFIMMAATTFYATKLFDGPTNSQSTYFLIPYCLWLCFANYLGGAIWCLNRGRTKED